MTGIMQHGPLPLESVPPHRPLGWEPTSLKWRGRVARRLVWERSAQAAANVPVSAHLTVELGRARARCPLVAVTRHNVTRAGWTTSPPELVISLTQTEVAWWLTRGVGEVWVLRSPGVADVYRAGTTTTVRAGFLQHRPLGLGVDLGLLSA